MACYVMEPSHYSNQCLLLVNEVLWCSQQSNVIPSAQATNLYDEFKNHTFQIAASSTSGQWTTTNMERFYIFLT